MCIWFADFSFKYESCENLTHMSQFFLLSVTNYAKLGEARSGGALYILSQYLKEKDESYIYNFCNPS